MPPSTMTPKGVEHFPGVLWLFTPRPSALDHDAERR